MENMVNIKYFIAQCLKVVGDNLVFIINTDSYLRQPCYSSRARDFYYLIVYQSDERLIARIRYIQAEFPELCINYLTASELLSYPAQGKWQFSNSPIVYSRDEKESAIVSTKEDNLQAISQAIVGVGHIARLYYLRSMNLKSHTWAVRQLGWAFRYTENGIVKLYNLIVNGTYTLNNSENNKANDVSWLSDINNSWETHEKALLKNNDVYQKYALRLNSIVQYFSEAISSYYENKNFIEDISYEYNKESYPFISDFREEIMAALPNDLLTLYISGSAARGDQHAGSDIDTIAVFSKLDNEVLSKLRAVITKYKDISVYSLSIYDLISYPSFRYYTLNKGTVKIAGKISFVSMNNDLYSILVNNLYIIRQISRSYLILNTYGERAVHLLRLMMKLADHGCMRPYINLKSGQYPSKKEIVAKYFENIEVASEVLNYLNNLNNNYEDSVNSCVEGNHEPIINGFTLLNRFSLEFTNFVDNRDKVGYI